MLSKNLFSLALSIVAFCTFNACQENLISVDEPQIRTYPGVDQALWTYWESFEIAARKHGLQIDLARENITGRISEISDNGVAGTCRYGSHITNQVTIDQSYWNRASNLGREYVVFHELGHCFLHRGHDDGSTSQGLCVSLMNSGLGDCYSAYNATNREYYLNELFSSSNN